MIHLCHPSLNESAIICILNVIQNSSIFFVWFLFPNRSNWHKLLYSLLLFVFVLLCSKTFFVLSLICCCSGPCNTSYVCCCYFVSIVGSSVLLVFVGLASIFPVAFSILSSCSNCNCPCYCCTFHSCFCACCCCWCLAYPNHYFCSKTVPSPLSSLFQSQRQSCFSVMVCICSLSLSLSLSLLYSFCFLFCAIVFNLNFHWLNQFLTCLLLSPSNLSS